MATRRLDRSGKRIEWDAARKAERGYMSRLLGVARQIGEIVRAFAPDGNVGDPLPLQRMLEGYSRMLAPWADVTARYMIADVARRNEKIWKSVGAQISSSIAGELVTSPQGVIYRDLMAEQVGLIQSIPLDAAKRVQQITTEALLQGRRAESIAKEIRYSQHVSESKARLIARTEVSRTASTFMEARSIAAGSEGYIWRSSTDMDVRPTHKAMEGKYVRWDSPPKTDKNLEPYHAGCGPNCRCFPEPVFTSLLD